MAKFQKGNKKTTGRQKGSKNKATLLFQFKGITENDKKVIFDEAMKLVKKGNVTIISKFLDKMLPNAIPKDENNNPIMPEIIFNVIHNQ